MLSLEEQNRLRQSFQRRHPEWRPATEVFADLVRQRLKPNSRVLDLGCGRGGLVEQLDYPLDQMVGVDPDLYSLRRHRLADGESPLARVAAFNQALPFAAHSFDLVFASWVLEHLQQPQRDFAQIARLLRPEGAFVFITPNRRHPLAMLNRLLGRFNAMQDVVVGRLYGRNAADTFPVRYRANTAADLRSLGAAAGLTLTEIHTISDPTYLAFSDAFFRLAAWMDQRLSPSRQIHLVGCFQPRD
ncbi:MAG: methyltransferase domain-containing protein [Candidatus Promineifilaceae bacterium]|nr:methyltransferase domain-containing protein [Candidatus Promineifilaceae bacterium]